MLNWEDKEDGSKQILNRRHLIIEVKEKKTYEDSTEQYEKWRYQIVLNVVHMIVGWIL